MQTIIFQSHLLSPVPVLPFIPSRGKEGERKQKLEANTPFANFRYIVPAAKIIHLGIKSNKALYLRKRSFISYQKRGVRSRPQDFRVVLFISSFFYTSLQLTNPFYLRV